MLKTLFLAPLLFFSSHLAHSAAIPANTSPVVDEVGLLSAEQQSQLSNSLTKFRSDYGPQIQVLVISSLAGDNLEDYSIRLAEAWKTGSKANNDGVILLVVLEDHRARIEVGSGLEGKLPDITAGRIIETKLIPEFKAGRPANGILLAVQEIGIQLGGQLQNSPSVSAAPESAPVTNGFSFGSLLPLLILAFLILPRLFGNRTSNSGGFFRGLLLGGLIGSNQSSSGGLFGGGSSGGGFFGGGGGGGFNGGGASGQW